MFVRYYGNSDDPPSTPVILVLRQSPVTPVAYSLSKVATRPFNDNARHYIVLKSKFVSVSQGRRALRSEHRH